MNVLVVDDSVTMRKIVVLALGKNDMTIVEAENGKQALDLVGKNSFDLMILDINMPELSGMEFLKELKKTPHAGKVPIIMLSTHTEKEIQDEALALGAKAFMTKPFQKADLQAQVLAVTGKAI
jgi:two-component system chemotaxis response regulator CheY